MRKPPRCDEGRTIINVSSSSLVDPLRLWVNPAAAVGSPLMPNMCNNSRVGLDCPRTTTLKASVWAKIETRSLSDNCSIAGEVRSDSAAHFRTFADKDPCDLLPVALRHRRACSAALISCVSVVVDFRAPLHPRERTLLRSGNSIQTRPPPGRISACEWIKQQLCM